MYVCIFSTYCLPAGSLQTIGRALVTCLAHEPYFKKHRPVLFIVTISKVLLNVVLQNEAAFWLVRFISCRYVNLVLLLLVF